MTRVLILSWEYPPLIEGGLARHVRKLSEALVERDVEVHVLTRGGEESPAEERRGGVHIHRIREPRRPTELGEFVAWVERMNSDMLAAGVELGDRYSFDLVHGHDWLVANACDHLAKRFDAPLLMTIHATEHGRHQGWVEDHPQTYIHGVERWIANRSGRVIACSQYMSEQIADIFGVDEKRVSVIPNGIDPGDLQPQDEAELKRLRAEFAAPEERLVLLIGRLVYEKGFQLALEAMPRVIEEAPGTRFLVAGSGTHEAELHKQAEDLGLMDQGTFLGWIGDDVLHSLYRIADLTVVPSIYEPFGLVALEAMASGCPCIVADTGGLREVVPHEEAGLRFRAHDPDALAEVAIRVLSDDELGHRLVAEAYEHVRRFDWGDVAEQTAALYADLVGGGGRGWPPWADPPSRRGAPPGLAACCLGSERRISLNVPAQEGDLVGEDRLVLGPVVDVEVIDPRIDAQLTEWSAAGRRDCLGGPGDAVGDADADEPGAMQVRCVVAGAKRRAEQPARRDAVAPA